MPWTQLGPASEPAPPAGRGDGAMIEATGKALYEAAVVNIQVQWDDLPENTRQLWREDAAVAAAVIVPATAEHIAVEFENWSETATWLTSDTCRAVANMIRSLDFGVGLSAAGATTGEDGDE